MDFSQLPMPQTWWLQLATLILLVVAFWRLFINGGITSVSSLVLICIANAVNLLAHLPALSLLDGIDCQPTWLRAFSVLSPLAWLLASLGQIGAEQDSPRLDTTAILMVGGSFASLVAWLVATLAMLQSILWVCANG